MLPLSRRDMLTRCGTGVGILALAGVLADDDRGAEPADQLAPKKPPPKAKAKHVAHLFMNGDPSQVDTFDPKPELDKLHGKPLPASLRTERKTEAAMWSRSSSRSTTRAGSR